ncbi:unnamed protein product, partial [Polarella glacialis]
DDDSDDDEPAPKAKAKAKAAAKQADDDDEDEEEEEEEDKPAGKQMKTKIQLRSDQDSEDLTVFVGGLPWSTSEEQIKKDFEECGEVTRFALPKNEEGKPKGIAFITYADREGVDKALKFNGDDYGGRTLKVNLASDKSSIGGGKGKDGKGKAVGQGTGGVRNDALTIKVIGLSWDLSQETVEKDFAECGEFARCSMPKNEEGKPRGIAFIQFNDEE